MASIREQLLQAFRKSGLTLQSLADQVGLDRGGLHRKLHSDEHAFDVRQAQDVAAALGHTIVWQAAPARRRSGKASAGARA